MGADVGGVTSVQERVEKKAKGGKRRGKDGKGKDGKHNGKHDGKRAGAGDIISTCHQASSVAALEQFEVDDRSTRGRSEPDNSVTQVILDLVEWVAIEEQHHKSALEVLEDIAWKRCRITEALLKISNTETIPTWKIT